MPQQQNGHDRGVFTGETLQNEEASYVGLIQSSLAPPALVTREKIQSCLSPCTITVLSRAYLLNNQ